MTFEILWRGTSEIPVKVMLNNDVFHERWILPAPFFGMRYISDARHFSCDSTLKHEIVNKSLENSVQLFHSRSPSSSTLLVLLRFEVLKYYVKLILKKNSCFNTETNITFMWVREKNGSPFSTFQSGSRTSSYCIFDTFALCDLTVSLQNWVWWPERACAAMKDRNRWMKNQDL